MFREKIVRPARASISRIVSGIILAILLGQPASAANSWYWGEVTEIITSTSDGSFIIYINNTTLQATCANARVNFNVSDMGVERTRAALAMALAAYTADKQWGVVVNLPSPGSVCTASPTSTQGAGIRG